jgi:hypothetical protein
VLLKWNCEKRELVQALFMHFDHQWNGLAHGASDDRRRAVCNRQDGSQRGEKQRLRAIVVHNL